MDEDEEGEWLAAAVTNNQIPVVGGGGVFFNYYYFREYFRRSAAPWARRDTNRRRSAVEKLCNCLHRPIVIYKTDIPIIIYTIKIIDFFSKYSIIIETRVAVRTLYSCVGDNYRSIPTHPPYYRIRRRIFYFFSRLRLLLT